MTKQQVLDDAMKLSDADRRELAEALFDSVESIEAIPPQWQAEFDRRQANAKAHPEKNIPLDEFLDWLENRPLAEEKKNEREAG